MHNFPEKLVVNVTAEDIASGVPNDCSDCPIARAIQRALPEYHVDVTRSKIELARPTGDGEVWSRGYYELPDVARKFVLAFDTDHQASYPPFSFTATLIPVA